MKKSLFHPVTILLGKIAHLQWCCGPCSQNIGNSQDLYECLNMDKISKFYIDTGQTFLRCSSKQTALHLKLMSLNQPYVTLLLDFLLLLDDTTGNSTLISAHLWQVQPCNLFPKKSLAFSLWLEVACCPILAKNVATTWLLEFYSDYPVLFSYLSCLFTCWYTWGGKGIFTN